MSQPHELPHLKRQRSIVLSVAIDCRMKQTFYLQAVHSSADSFSYKYLNNTDKIK